jgi:hypothetical protein
MLTNEYRPRAYIRRFTVSTTSSGLRGIPFMDCLDTVGYMGDDGGNRNLGEGRIVTELHAGTLEGSD